MKVRAYAKVNLSLDILGRREDGYHELELTFQPVSLWDELIIEPSEMPGIRLSCSVKSLEGPDNLVCRAYEALAAHYPHMGGCIVRLEKNIPFGAGMGGGSTDAAAFLLAARSLWHLDLSDRELGDLGAALGADVPACLFEGATLGRGIGEQLCPIATELEYPLLVIKPAVSFNTGEMYRRYDLLAEHRKPGEEATRGSTQDVVEALEAGDLVKLGASLFNVFEQTVPEPGLIRQLKAELMQAGALGALMTGSGSAVYGIFEDVHARDAACGKLRAWGDVYRCEAVNYGKRKRS